MSEKSKSEKAFDLFEFLSSSVRQFNKQQNRKFTFTNKYFAESDLVKVSQTDLNMYQLIKGE